MRSILLVLIFLQGMASGVALAAIPEDEYQRARRIVQEINTLIEQSAFDILDQRLNQVQQHYEQSATGERELHESFAIFWEKRTDSDVFERSLSAWLESAPRSYAAHTARGIWYIHRGHEERGTNYRSETNASQFSAMRRWFKLGRKDLELSLMLSSKPLLSHMWLFNAAMRSGRHQERESHFRAAITYASYSTELRDLYMMSLEPRWGGSYERMEAFARESEAVLGRGEAANKLWNKITADRAYVLLSSKKFELAHDMLSKALAQADSAQFHCMRAHANIELNQWPEAMDDLSASTRYTGPHTYCSGIVAWAASVREDGPGMLEVLNSYVPRNPKNDQLYMRRGWIHQKRDDFASAYVDYAAAAELGNVWSQTMTGRYLFNGWGGVEKNPDKAILLLRAAAETGDADAQLSLRQALEAIGLTEEPAQQKVPEVLLKRMRPINVTTDLAPENSLGSISEFSDHRIIASLLGGIVMLFWLRRDRRAI